MGKKDFSNSTENVFDDFFSQPTEIKKREVKEVETKPADEKKEVKVTPKKEEIKKEKTPKQAVVVKKEVSDVETKVDEKTKELKSHTKECRFNFYLDIELADFVNNHLWLTRQKNFSQYFNKLIRENLLDILGLPADTSKEVLAQKWEEYKKENDL